MSTKTTQTKDYRFINKKKIGNTEKKPRDSETSYNLRFRNKGQELGRSNIIAAFDRYL